MNNQEADVLLEIAQNSGVNQRTIAKHTGWSLGIVNRAIQALVHDGYIGEGDAVSDKGREEIAKNKPRRAVILAAGYGMRMVPINMSTPKALLTVNGERLIERLIRQLHEAGIEDITVVVGFMKDQFEYLIDTYGVKLLVNAEYSRKNNLHSLAMLAGKSRTLGPAAEKYNEKRPGNIYIVPCDLWCENNPFRKDELYSWYMMSEENDPDSRVRVNRKKEVARIRNGEKGQRMIGISYLCEDDWVNLSEALRQMDDDVKYIDAFWEEALFPGGQDRMDVKARCMSPAAVVEINTYEQLREIDAGSDHLQSEAIRLIADTFGVKNRDITNISMLKKGMTNRSFLFTVKGKKYICRIPGEGSDKLINRREEAAVFRAIKGKGLCDDPVVFSEDKGYKITQYLEGVHCCDPHSMTEMSRCISMLRDFHRMKLKVDHSFDLFGLMDFYENLWNGEPSIYRDYRTTKENVLSLKEFIDSCPKDWCLTHVDPNQDNYLFYEEDGEEKLQLTDWEYAGMQDPHLDIAMFGIYAMYDKADMDRLIDLYFEGKTDTRTRAKIYCYIAASGFLWSNWCEYKLHLGVEFGEYSLAQYRYAKEYYRYAKELIAELSKQGKERKAGNK